MMTPTKQRLITALSALALTACGGGGGGDANAPEEAPSEAVASDQSSDDTGTDKTTTVVVDGCEISRQQARVLKAVNEFRSQPQSCGDKSFNSAPAVSYSCALQPAADRHSNDMASNNFFSHTGSDGLKVAQRVSEQTDYQWSLLGENIAAGFSDPQAMVKAWGESTGHCKNLMNPDFDDMAVKRVDGKQTDYDNYWTQVLGGA
ncbi:CAP domain-containing protein [Tamilnaduibacter salinus]|nr:CAP domain-containing protein [Tamilnaduibacter salinus]